MICMLTSLLFMLISHKMLVTPVNSAFSPLIVSSQVETKAGYDAYIIHYI